MNWKTITVRKVGDLPVWHVASADKVTLAMTFLRMQEWYESANPDFFGKVFTLDAFKAWYAKGHKGRFSYPYDWAGFNVPSTAAHMVRKHFPEHSVFEKRLFRKLDRLGVFDLECFYLIGSKSSSPRVLAHELRHALYFTTPDYRREVDLVLEKFPVASLKRRLRKMGYAETVIDDEVQAWALTGWPHGLHISHEMSVLKKALREAEKKYLHLLPST
jgi:hypothetical protein